jgi:hypothetical protein
VKGLCCGRYLDFSHVALHGAASGDSKVGRGGPPDVPRDAPLFTLEIAHDAAETPLVDIVILPVPEISDMPRA